MPFVSVKGDVEDILFDLNHVQKDIAPVVVANALNTVAFEARDETVSRMAANMGAPVRLIDPRAFVVKSTKKKQEAAIRVLTLPLPAEKLNYSVSKTAGVTAGNVHFPRGFESTMKSGHTGVFQRKGRPRLPIKKLGMPMIRLNNYVKNAINHKSFVFVDIFDEEMTRELEKKRS